MQLSCMSEKKLWLTDLLLCLLHNSGYCERRLQASSWMTSTGPLEAFSSKGLVQMQNPSHLPLRTRITWVILRYWKSVSARWGPWWSRGAPGRSSRRQLVPCCRWGTCWRWCPTPSTLSCLSTISSERGCQPACVWVVVEWFQFVTAANSGSWAAGIR